MVATKSEPMPSALRRNAAKPEHESRYKIALKNNDMSMYGVTLHQLYGRPKDPLYRFNLGFGYAYVDYEMPSIYSYGIFIPHTAILPPGFLDIFLSAVYPDNARNFKKHVKNNQVHITKILGEKSLGLMLPIEAFGYDNLKKAGLTGSYQSYTDVEDKMFMTLARDPLRDYAEVMGITFPSVEDEDKVSLTSRAMQTFTGKSVALQALSLSVGAGMGTLAFDSLALTGGITAGTVVASTLALAARQERKESKEEEKTKVESFCSGLDDLRLLLAKQKKLHSFVVEVLGESCFDIFNTAAEMTKTDLLSIEDKTQFDITMSSGFLPVLNNYASSVSLKLTGSVMETVETKTRTQLESLYTTVAVIHERGLARQIDKVNMMDIYISSKSLGE